MSKLVLLGRNILKSPHLWYQLTEVAIASCLLFVQVVNKVKVAGLHDKGTYSPPNRINKLITD